MPVAVPPDTRPPPPAPLEQDRFAPLLKALPFGPQDFPGASSLEFGANWRARQDLSARTPEIVKSLRQRARPSSTGRRRRTATAA